jgi:Ca2+-binding EF-hand superfamily protein
MPTATSRRVLAFAAFVLATPLALSALPALARPAPVDRTLAGLDPDRDGTLDLREVKRAASALFHKLDGDKDGTLTLKELRGRLGRAEFRKADPDRDGTLSKREYLAVVEGRFRAANPDRDGTLDARELASPRGRALLRLLK